MNGLLKHLLQNPYSKPILPLHSGVVWSWWRYSWFSGRLIPLFVWPTQQPKCYNVYPWFTPGEVPITALTQWCYFLKRWFLVMMITYLWHKMPKWWKLMLLLIPHEITIHFLLFTFHYSQLLFTIHCYCSWYCSLWKFCLFKGGCPLYRTQKFFFQKLSWEPFFEKEFLVSTLGFPTTFPTNLVTRTSSKPCNYWTVLIS